MPRVLVIGYGNPLRGDDGLGWKIASGLAATIQGETIKVLAMHQLTPELSELISEVEFVVFIDAAHVGRPGSWKCETIEPKASSPQTLGHQLAPASLLDFARAIFKASPPAVLVSVAGSCFDCCQELTPPVAATLPAVEQFVREKIAGFCTFRESRLESSKEIGRQV